MGMMLSTESYDGKGKELSTIQLFCQLSTDSN